MLTCEVTRAPNFQTFLQTSGEFCNKNIPVAFTTNTNNGCFDFLTYDFATYKIDSLASQRKAFVKKFDFPEFCMLNLDFFDFPG